MDFNLDVPDMYTALDWPRVDWKLNKPRTYAGFTAETYSKHIHPGDKSVRTIFWDAASATLVQAVSSDHDKIGPFVYGTDGRDGIT